MQLEYISITNYMYTSNLWIHFRYPLLQVLVRNYSESILNWEIYLSLSNCINISKP